MTSHRTICSSLSEAELAEIDRFATESGINLWAATSEV